MLLDLLKNKKCFKLICGAGNEDVLEVEKLVALYSMAGCNFFDLCAKPEVINAAKKGLKKAGIKKDRYLCCSIGVKGDPHISKALINPKYCINCGKCKAVCSQNAINKKSSFYEINKIRCIGCGHCISSCAKKAIKMTSEVKNIKEILPPLIETGIDCIEFHIQGVKQQEIYEKWNEINKLYNGALSICIDRSKLGNEAILKMISKMIKIRKPYTTIIQADGAPMSGGKDDFKTTLQAVAMAEIFQNANLPVYILLSGGTNSKSTKLAKMCAVDTNGIAIGSFARKIVRQYVDKENFLDNKEELSKALIIAKKLVNVSLKNMG